MNRRKFLVASAASVATAYASRGLAQNSIPSEGVRRAAGALLETFSQRSQIVLPLGSERRTNWHWFPDWDREGRTLGQMTATQRQAAMALLQASVGPAGYSKAQEIMALQRDLGRDPSNYYFSIYGDPSQPNWAWGVEGHHLSLNYSIAGQRVSGAPLFLGASPTYQGSARRATMRREEEAARELMRSLETSLRSRALFSQETPGDTVTRNAIQAQPLETVGVQLSQLSASQQGLIQEILREYLSVWPAVLASARLEQLRAELPNARFAWAGSLEPRNRHYYRIQGSSFLLEHDNSRDGGTHIHSVWRELENDFGRAWL